MSIEHIPANDWAAVGARLERCWEFHVRLYPVVEHPHAVVWTAKGRSEGHGKTPLEALTAALDAAEGAK